MKNKVHYHKIEITGVIPMNISLFTGKTVFDCLKDIEKRFELDNEMSEGEKQKRSLGLHFTVTDDDGYKYFILVLSKESSIGTVSHEILHSAWDFLYHYDIQVDYYNQEILARTIDLITINVLKYLPCKIKIKHKK